MYSCWARGRICTTTAKSRALAALGMTQALAAIALAGLKTRHYNLRVERAQIGMAELAGNAAVAAVDKHERTQRGTVLGAIGGHGDLQKERLDFGIFGGASRRRGALLNRKSLLERRLPCQYKFRSTTGVWLLSPGEVFVPGRCLGLARRGWYLQSPRL